MRDFYFLLSWLLLYSLRISRRRCADVRPRRSNSLNRACISAVISIPSTALICAKLSRPITNSAERRGTAFCFGFRRKPRGLIGLSTSQDSVREVPLDSGRAWALLRLRCDSNDTQAQMGARSRCFAYSAIRVVRQSVHWGRRKRQKSSFSSINFSTLNL